MLVTILPLLALSSSANAFWYVGWSGTECGQGTASANVTSTNLDIPLPMVGKPVSLWVEGEAMSGNLACRVQRKNSGKGDGVRHYRMKSMPVVVEVPTCLKFEPVEGEECFLTSLTLSAAV